MVQQSKWEKVLNYSIGCLGLVGILATVIALLVALAQPTKVVIWLQRYASLPTPSPIVVTMPPAEPSSADVANPTSQPTDTPFPTPTRLPAPTSTSVPSVSPSPAIALPLSDNFNNGARSEWEPYVPMKMRQLCSVV